MQVLCRLDHVECNEYSRYLVDQWMSLPNPDTESPIPVSIQGQHIITLDIVKLRERKGQRVDLGRSLKGHL